MTLNNPINPENPHWGHWVWQRAIFVGHRKQTSIAKMIGCTPSHFCRLLTMRTPPAIFRKDIDVKLIQALRVDRQTLFADYIKVSPKSAPVTGSSLPDSDESSRQKLISAATRLTGEKLQVLAAAAQALMV